MWSYDLSYKRSIIERITYSIHNPSVHSSLTLLDLPATDVAVARNYCKSCQLLPMKSIILTWVGEATVTSSMVTSLLVSVMISPFMLTWHTHAPFRIDNARIVRLLLLDTYILVSNNNHIYISI